MTSTPRQINLYNPRLLAAAPVLSAGRVAGVWLLGLCCLLTWGWRSHVSLEQLRDERAPLETQLETMRQSLEGLQNRLSQRPADPVLAQAVRQLETRSADRELARQWLEAQLRREHIPYSDWLLALSAARHDGVWLNHIEFNGASMTLEGRSLDPDLLPDWLQQLKKRPSLNGLAFSGFEMASPVSALSKTSGAPSPLSAIGSGQQAADVREPVTTAGKTFRLTGLKPTDDKERQP